MEVWERRKEVDDMRKRKRQDTEAIFTDSTSAASLLPPLCSTKPTQRVGSYIVVAGWDLCCTDLMI